MLKPNCDAAKPFYYKLPNKWKVTFTMQVKKTIQHWLTLKLLNKWKVKFTMIVKKPIDICWLKVSEQMEG